MTKLDLDKNTTSTIEKLVESWASLRLGTQHFGLGDSDKEEDLRLVCHRGDSDREEDCQRGQRGTHRQNYNKRMFASKSDRDSDSSVASGNSLSPQPPRRRMTAGSTILRNLSWSLKSKKRHRSGSGGSKDIEKKKPLTNEQQRRLSTSRKLSTGSSSSGGLEIVAPSTSNVEFKYSWTIESFIKSVKSCKTEAGIDSRPFDINVNGVLTTWNLSVRFWVGETGERLANPFVLCLNLLSSKVDKPLDVNVKYKFGIYNRGSEEFEMGAIDRVGLRLEQTEKLQSIGYKNIAISEKHVNSAGDVSLVVRLTIIKENEANHSLSSDLKNLIDDEKSSDLILQSGSREFRVHSNILAARSPVFAALLKEKQLDEDEETIKDNKIEETIEEKDEGDEHTEVKEADKHIEAKEGEDNKIKDNEPIIKERKSISPRKISLGPSRLEIKDLPPDTLEVLLKYIYTDSSNNVDLFSQTLLAASDRYQLPGLKVHCEKHLGEIINPENVSDILLLSETHRCDTLKKTALAYCGENHSYIMKDSRWKVIEEEKPDLFEEAISVVAGGICDSHEECLKKAGNRYECEKADKNQKSNKQSPKFKQGARKKSN